MIRSFSILTASLIAFATQAAGAEAPWRVTETVHYAWRAHAPEYKFIVEEQKPESGDVVPHRLAIVGPGTAALKIEPEGGVVSIHEALMDQEAVAADNLSRSKYVYVTPKLRAAAGEPMAIVFGWPFASDPGPLMIYALDAAGKPRLVFSHDNFSLSRIADLNGDGVPELIGLRSFSQTFDECNKTYDPFAVYRFTSAARTAMQYDEALSKTYNEGRGGWAGPDAREDIAVSMCGPTKGRIVPKPEQ